MRRQPFLLAALAALAPTLPAAQTTATRRDSTQFAALRWREIGPFRADDSGDFLEIDQRTRGGFDRRFGAEYEHAGPIFLLLLGCDPVDVFARGLLLLIREAPQNEVFHLVGSASLSPYEIGVAVAREYGFDPALVRPSTLADYLKSDPRPRQKTLRLSNAKWAAFAKSRGLTRPIGVDEGIKILRNSTP